MKKYGLALLVLIACIFTSMISESAAIYTHSNDFDFVVRFVKTPIINGDFIKYELSDQKICDYDRPMIGSPEAGPNLRNCAQGSATYDDYNNVVNLSQDAGFFKYFKEMDAAYMVNGSFDYDASQSPKNFGMYINGSFYQLAKDDTQIGSNTMQSTGYVVLFDKDGNLVINEQGVVNYKSAGDYAEDILKTARDNPVRNIHVASQQTVAQILQNSTTPATIKLQVRVKKNDRDLVEAYVYINGVLVKNEPTALGYDLRSFNQAGIYDNIIIGASTYGVHTTIKVTHLDKQVWDGSSF